MTRLTSYETARADAHDTGMASWDEDGEAREMSALRAGWVLLDSPVPAHPRNPAVPHWHEDRITRSQP